MDLQDCFGAVKRTYAFHKTVGCGLVLLFCQVGYVFNENVDMMIVVHLRTSNGTSFICRLGKR